MLERDPDNQLIMRQRLNVLAQLGNDDAIEAQLQDMLVRFPDNDAHKATLIRFYMSREQTDKAEAYLRGLAAASEEFGPKMDLVRFLLQVRGPDATRAELNDIIAKTSNPVSFQLILTSIDFDEGKQGAAIAALEKIVQTAEEPSEEIRNAKIALARMQLATGNEVGARARISEILAEDSNHAEALKIQAAWQIDADDPDSAIANLRTALDKNPEDSQAMTLMAQAYERAGRPALARDFLALAVEASGNAPAETIRYARYLIAEEKFLPAEDLLISALRLAPQDMGLLIALGELYLNMEDFGRTEQVAKALRNLDTPEARQAANGIDAERISRQSGVEEAVDYLEKQAVAADATLASRLALVRAQLVAGDLDGALALAQEIQTQMPDNPGITGVLANVEVLAGNLDKAETLYRSLLAKEPTISGSVWLQLAQLKVRQGDSEAGEAVIEEGLIHSPENAQLLWVKASYMEKNGDTDGAINIYENLYARNSGALVVANNLASLMATYRDDEESLERAWVVARRFKDTEVPALQDTYGWIVHRRGDSEAALPYLEVAAERLSNDAIVQFHLAEVYLSLGRGEDALRKYRNTVDLAGPADQRDQIVAARDQIKKLQEQADN